MGRETVRSDISRESWSDTVENSERYFSIPKNVLSQNKPESF